MLFSRLTKIKLFRSRSHSIFTDRGIQIAICGNVETISSEHFKTGRMSENMFFLVEIPNKLSHDRKYVISFTWPTTKNCLPISVVNGITYLI
jgi:hypothetical protein